MRTRTERLGWCVATGILLCACGDDRASRGLGGGQLGTHPGPQFPGAGTGTAGNAIAGGPALSCGAPIPFPAFSPVPGAQGTIRCFYGPDDKVTPAATVEWIVESAVSADLVHVRLTLNPDFVDNSYGDNAIGWGATDKADPKPGKDPKPGAKNPKPGGGKGGHTFKDLVGSDHAEFKLRDANGKLSSHFKADYLSEDSRAPSGYGTLGVGGGEGKQLLGSSADIAAVSTSLDRNLNACGLDDFTVNSPGTDALYTPNVLAPNWDYRVVYDVWVREAAFGTVGFGGASVDFVHASPSKQGGATVEVTPGDCPPPPYWEPYCTEPDGCCFVADGVCGQVPPTPPPKVDAGCLGSSCVIGI